MRSSLLLALLCHLVLAGGYCLVTPALEAPHEEEYVEAASRAALGFGCADPATALLAGGLRLLGQPDLVATTLPADTLPADTLPADTLPTEGPPSDRPRALRLRHGADEVERTPAQQALRVLRALSILLGLVTIVCTHATARRVFPDSGVAAVASLLLACMPQWAFSHAVVWHGPLLIAAAHALLLVQVNVVARGDPRLGDALVAGVLAALALATARAGWAVAALGAAGLVLAPHCTPRRRLGLLLLFAAIAGSGLLARPSLPVAPAGARGTLTLVRSFVGEFGRSALLQPPPPEILTVAMLAMAIAGWVVGGRRLVKRRQPLLLVSLACSLGTMAGVSAAVRDGLHGRHLLLAAGPMMIMTAVGIVAAWRRFAPVAARHVARHPLAVLVPFLPSLVLLLVYVRPALRLPPPTDTFFATLHADLRTRPATGLHAMVRHEQHGPDATAVLTWDPPPGTSRFAVIGWDGDGRVAFGSWVRDGVILDQPAWPVPPAVAARAAAAPLSWRTYTVEPIAAADRAVMSPVLTLAVPKR